MQGQLIEQLTDAQRACLRLVYTHHNSKEIAARIGVSPSAIDKRIERAVQILRVSSRFEAARRLHEHEVAASGGVAVMSDWLPSEPIDVPSDVLIGFSGPADGPWGFARRFLGLSPGGEIDGGARVRYTRTERLIRLIVYTALVAVASVAIVNLLLTVTTLLRANRGNALSYSPPMALGARQERVDTC